MNASNLGDDVSHHPLKALPRSPLLQQSFGIALTDGSRRFQGHFSVTYVALQGSLRFGMRGFDKRNIRGR
jgi:hypothetical protein